MAFEILKKETLFEGRIFSVQRQHLRLPDGREIASEIVSHPGAITLVPVDDQGNILFVRQYRYGAGKSLLELPAGMLEPDEDPLVCAAREVREETGKAADTLQKLGEFYMAPGYSSEYMYVYLATGLHDSPLDADEDEFLQIESIPAAEVFRMVDQGTLQDGKSLAALLLARPHLMG